MAGLRFALAQAARMLLALFPLKNGLVVTVNRTNWHFGVPINVFMIGIAWRGLAFPVMWRLLPKTGISSTGERIEKLVALLAVAFAWAYLRRNFCGGDCLEREAKPIKIKSDGRRAKSVFRYGLDHLRLVLLNVQAKVEERFAYLHVLPCT